MTCGAEARGVDPKASEFKCEVYGSTTVYGAAQLCLLQVGPDPDALLADAKIKARARVLEVDFFLPSLNTAVEFDEKQHFTEERRISLQCYEPAGFTRNVGFSCARPASRTLILPAATGSARSGMQFAISAQSNTASSLFVSIIGILESQNAQRPKQVTGLVR